MSENKPEEISQTEEASIAFTGTEDDLSIEFTDGVHAVPEYVVRGLGGAEKLKSIAENLKKVSYQDFMAGFRLTIEKRDLNEFQRKFVATHFGNKF